MADETKGAPAAKKAAPLPKETKLPKVEPSARDFVMAAVMGLSQKYGMTQEPERIAEHAVKIGRAAHEKMK